MTESDYLASKAAPKGLFRRASAKSGRTKMRLVCAAACRLIPELPERFDAALTVLEDYARGLCDEEAYRVGVEHFTRIEPPTHQFWDVPPDFRWIIWQAFFSPVHENGLQLSFDRMVSNMAVCNNATSSRFRAETCDIIRDICGNPFRPWHVLPPWMGRGVIQPTGEEVRFSAHVQPLAEVIDRHRHYDRLPILADALEESGVTDAELLGHCRGEGTHHPGCWAVDLALGRAIRAR